MTHGKSNETKQENRPIKQRSDVQLKKCLAFSIVGLLTVHSEDLNVERIREEEKLCIGALWHRHMILGLC